jgi:SpoVK/Ycf46/Vps4 family AAA+-type ATPase
MAKFNGYYVSENLYAPRPSQKGTNTLPAGVYNFQYDAENDQAIFEKTSLFSDELVPLPCSTFDVVTKQISQFLRPETKQKYIDWKFLYKRSVLLYGTPGGGKTASIMQIVRNSISENEAIVLFNPTPVHLPKAFEYLKSTNPDTTIIIIFEELDQLCERFEEELLHVLDGELQTDNVIYLSTTNYIDRVPARIQRPGRTSLVIEVGLPSKEARKAYLVNKIGDKVVDINVDNIVELTEGLTIDELKEVLLSAVCMDADVGEVVKRMKNLKKREDYFEDVEDTWKDEWELSKQINRNKQKLRR